MIRIYHTSDLHDRRGIVPRLQALRARDPGLLFDCGDSLRGSQTVYRRDEPIVAEIDAAGYDAQAIGNREFHYLFGCLRARARRMHHPLVCTNLVDTKGRPLPFAPVLLLHYGGVTVHVLGLLIMQYPAGSPWERLFGWRFLDPWDAVAPYASAMPEGELLVVLSHVGLKLDRRLAQRVPRIDLILGGHSHDTLHQPEYVDAVPIVHAGPYGRYVSRTELEYDPSQRRFAITSFELLGLLGNAS
ncbi:MAG TPA: metallophosphoesterase [Candidatus Baltobacteraceae bacterium]|nr:metallophosphoesterase [Candidatus Baltobacteraceae bacterium]